MSGDLQKRRLPGVHDRTHADVEAALARQRRDFEDAAEAGEAYSPAAPGDWADPPPTTLREALDRLAAANTGA